MEAQIGYLLGAFGITALFGFIILPWLKKLQIKQHVRDDGPESHLKKEGTPSMGGLIFLKLVT